MATSNSRTTNSNTNSNRNRNITEGTDRNRNTDRNSTGTTSPGVTTRSVAGAAEAPAAARTPLRDRKAVLSRFNGVRENANIGKNLALDRKLKKREKKKLKFCKIQFERSPLEYADHAKRYRIAEEFTDRSAKDFLRGMPAHLLPRRSLEPAEQQTVVVESREAYADHRFYVHPVTLAMATCIQGTPYQAGLVELGFREGPHMHFGATDSNFDLASILPASFLAQPQPVAAPTPLLPLLDRPAPLTPSFPKDLDAHWPKLFYHFEHSDITNKEEKESYAAAVVRAVEEKVLDKDNDAVYSPYYMWTNEVLKKHGYIKNNSCSKLSNYLSHYCYIVGKMSDQVPKCINEPAKKLGKMATAAKHDLWQGIPVPEKETMSWLLCAAHLAKTRTAAAAVS